MTSNTWDNPPGYEYVKWIVYKLRSGFQSSATHRKLGMSILRAWIEDEHITKKQYMHLEACQNEAGGGSYLPVEPPRKL